MYYAVSDYSATGEGRTICILVGNFTSKDRVKNRFAELFGEYMTLGIRYFSYDEFSHKYSSCIPRLADNLIRNLPETTEWYQRVHFAIA